MVVVHGGGWHAGDKRAVREVNICSDLALRGYVCLSVNYVLTPGPPAPWQIAKRRGAHRAAWQKATVSWRDPKQSDLADCSVNRPAGFLY